MDKVKKLRKPRRVNALALILSRIPTAAKSKKQRQQATERLYRDKDPIDLDSLC